MKRPVFKFAAITSLLLVTGLGGQLLFNSKPPTEEETEAVLGNARNLIPPFHTKSPSGVATNSGMRDSAGITFCIRCI
jgi:hypothetical protein